VMLYRIERWENGKPVRVGAWAWSNKGKAIQYAKAFVELLPYTVKIRQQQNRKIVYSRLPVTKHSSWYPIASRHEIRRQKKARRSKCK
jgi:hypothetical protein